MVRLNLNITKELEFFTLDIDFEVGEETFVLQGESGSGKTTILNCISGLVSPDKGSISLSDDILYDSDNKITKPINDRKVGYVFQNFALFPNLNNWKNVLFGVNTKDEADVAYAKSLMEAYNIGHLTKKYPKEISGGEKQRVAIVRALATKPKILLMDEPFSAIDENMKEMLYEQFLDMRKAVHIPIIIVTHNNQEAKLLGNRIAFLKSGHIQKIEKKGIDY